MPEFDNKKYLRELKADEKLPLLYHDLISLVDTVRGIAKVLRLIDSKSIRGLPDNFDFYINSLSRAGDQLKDVLALYMDSPANGPE